MDMRNPHAIGAIKNAIMGGQWLSVFGFQIWQILLIMLILAQEQYMNPFLSDQHAPWKRSRSTHVQAQKKKNEDHFRVHDVAVL